jgi:hypothetical protein
MCESVYETESVVMLCDSITESLPLLFTNFLDVSFLLTIFLNCLVEVLLKVNLVTIFWRFSSSYLRRSFLNFSKVCIYWMNSFSFFLISSLSTLMKVNGKCASLSIIKFFCFLIWVSLTSSSLFSKISL